MFVEVVRLFMVLLGTAAGFWVARALGTGHDSHFAGLGGVLGCLLGYVGGGALGRLLDKALGEVERRANSVEPARVVAGSVGAALGAIVAALGSAPLFLLMPSRVALSIAGLIVWTLGYAGGRILASQSAAICEMFGLSTRPLVRARAFDAREGVLADTSVLMDGQLSTLAQSGLLGGDLLVPRFVLDEMQGMADARDGTRARRAQRGLETLDALRREGTVRVFVLDDEVPEFDAVDAKLVALGRRLELRLLTNDSALARIAEVQGVPTCNLRRLGADLAPAVVPGDKVAVKLTREGTEDGQGVGHLDDGTMVVVNDGAQLVGGDVAQFEVTSVVPTSMGRLVFAREPEVASS